MSIIRNGGLERGSIEFWEVAIGGSIEISTLLPKYGTYCGKYIAGGAAPERVLNDDYVSVKPFDLVSLFAWLKSTTTRVVYPCLYLYDGDYSYIERVRGYGRAMDNTWLGISTQIPVMEGVEYVRAGFEINITAADEEFYWDGYACSIVTKDQSISGADKLLSSGLFASSFNTSTDKKDLQMYKEFECDLRVTYAGGTNQTLDVLVYEQDLSEGKLLVGTFAQMTAVGHERITLTHCTGRQLFIEAALGGVAPEFVMKCYVAGKG